MDNIIKFDKEKAKIKFNAFKQKVHDKVQPITDWASEHPDQAATALVTAIAISTKTAKDIRASKAEKRRTAELAVEQRKRDYGVWDASTGTWLYTKVPLTADDRTELAWLVMQGNSRVNALKQMHKI